MKWKNLAVNLALALASTLLTLGAVEVAARLYLTRLAPERVFNRYASLDQLTARHGRPRFVAHRYLGFIPAPDFSNGLNRHNSLGYRGEEIAVPKPEGVFRIVAIGGSTTYSAGVEDYRQSYPYLLQEKLRAAGYEQVEVINAGVFSYSSLENLMNFQLRVLELDPNLVIVYEGVNEIATRMIWPYSRYRGDLSGFEKRLLSFEPPWWEQITLARAALIYMDRIEPHSTLQRNFMIALGSFLGDTFVSQQLDGEYPSGVFERHPADEILATNRPVYYERNLRTLAAIAEARGIAVLFVSFVHSPEFPEEPRAWAEEYVAAYAEQNALLAGIAADTPAFFYNLAAVMPTDAEYFTDGIHFSASGNELRADFLTDYLLNSGLLPPP
ncbi:MAG: SGNH/GDSL hydrolase family protein [Chloroflexi bacterium]|nr:SGNH/GDSL hydrolase family protein [Chloroflexota bacterium]